MNAKYVNHYLSAIAYSNGNDINTQKERIMKKRTPKPVLLMHRGNALSERKSALLAVKLFARVHVHIYTVILQQ